MTRKKTEDRAAQMFAPTGANLKGLQPLTEKERVEVLGFLAARPVHTVVMTSFIQDNGLEGAANRGRFYGYRNTNKTLEGVALVGHTTLIEARSADSLAAFALIARQSDAPIHIIMSDGKTAEKFWKTYAGDNRSPRLICSELLFELSFPYFELGCDWNVRLAEREELAFVAEAHAEVAFAESGIDPMLKDRDGFLKRALNLIFPSPTRLFFSLC
ncbi:MAG: hypothetical protein M3525_03110 [Acidobacteriota bacterium]|nr:hypothetical protein [Acidobacteriota bacterium]